MFQKILKFYVSLLLLTAPLASHSNDEASLTTRRTFLAGLFTSAGVAAAAPSVLAAGSRSVAIPASVMRQLARLRLTSLDNIDSGLETYIQRLTKIMEETQPGRLKDFLNMRIEHAKKAHSVYQQIQLESQGEITTDHSTAGRQASFKKSEEERLKNLSRENQERIDSLGDLESISPDVRVLMIRGLLDVGLMNRMAWQARFGADNTILSEVDLKFLDDYRNLLQSTLERAPSQSLAAALTPQLIKEVDFTLESSFLWQKRKARAFSCKKII